MELKVNQKVLVTKMIRNDGTCAGCKRGTPVAYEGMEGFICEITEFHFEPVYVVHFLDINKKLGFRAQELEVIEDFDEEEGDPDEESRDDFLMLFVGPNPAAIMQVQRDLLVEDVVNLMERHFDGAELGGVVGEIDKLFSARFDALVNSLQISKPPRGAGGGSPGHGGGRRPRHLH